MKSMTQLKEEKAALLHQVTTAWQEAQSGGSGFDWSLVKIWMGTAEEKAAKHSQLQMELSEVTSELNILLRHEAEMKAAAQAHEADSRPAGSPPFGDGGGEGGYGGGGGYSGAVWRPQPINLREKFANSAELKTMVQNEGRGVARIANIPGGVKALISLATISPQTQRLQPVDMRLETRTVIDMIGTSPASAAALEWYEETTVTNAAVEVAEGSVKPEATIAWTLRTGAIKTIAVWVPVTRQALSDNDFLESQVRGRLVFMVQRREEAQVLNGDGAGENIRGILNTANVQTQAKGADSVPTAVFKALQKVRGATGSAFMEPDGIVMHPNDYTDFYTLQDTTGNFVLQAILQQSPDPRIWGLSIRQTTAMPENTALVGAFAAGAEVYTRGGMDVIASSEHGEFLTSNKVLLLAEERIGLAVQIPTAFCTVTGI